jgi:hypothetical protein
MGFLWTVNKKNPFFEQMTTLLLTQRPKHIRRRIFLHIYILTEELGINILFYMFAPDIRSFVF